MMANDFPIELLVLPALQRNPKTKKIHKKINKYENDGGSRFNIFGCYSMSTPD